MNFKSDVISELGKVIHFNKNLKLLVLNAILKLKFQK